MRKLWLGFLIVLFIFASFLALEFYKLYSYPAPQEDVIVLLLERDEIIDDLDKQHLIGSKVAMQLLDLFNRKLRNKYLKTGEYNFTKADNFEKLIGKIYKRERYVRKVTIPEGYTVKQIANLLGQTYGLTGELPPLKDCDLMPDTYFYYYGDPKNSIISKMRTEFDKFISVRGVNAEVVPGVVTLASIIERESGLNEERGKISSVFHNRLKIGMPLQSDPTVIYALSEGLGVIDAALSREGLGVDSPYNTYRNKGLPPTPIACPGRASIDAALNPEATDYLYFVAKGRSTPGHNFSSNLKDHNSNVNLYRSSLKNN